jgi:hypothetical protein
VTVTQVDRHMTRMRRIYDMYIDRYFSHPSLTVNRLAARLEDRVTGTGSELCALRISREAWIACLPLSVSLVWSSSFLPRSGDGIANNWNQRV